MDIADLWNCGLCISSVMPELHDKSQDTMLQLIFFAVLLNLASTASATPLGGWAIPSTSFNSQCDFDTYWNYNYPWGTDHNGGARMDSCEVSVGNGQLNLTSHPVTGQPPTNGGIPIHYLSGTVYAKQLFTVKQSGGYDFTGQFFAHTAKGTWPAIWLTGAYSWPPEIDLAEWKGNGEINFNSLAVNQTWSTHAVIYPDPGSFHNISVQLRDYNGVDVQIKFHLDGVLQSTQIGKGMVGAPFWLCVCLFISHDFAAYDLDYTS
jgi:galactan endo-beta-1,3-galactanase